MEELFVCLKINRSMLLAAWIKRMNAERAGIFTAKVLRNSQLGPAMTTKNYSIF
jgi:hypothetical protein